MPEIFISYRRQDASGHAGRLHDELARRFGQEQVFMDLSIEPGVDFVEQINDAVGSCHLLIALIGPRWTTVEGADGQRRLDDPRDFIRLEVEAALRRSEVRVIPVLVQGARMPSAEELPPSLADLARRNALELSDARWSYDVGRLMTTVERVLGGRPRPAVPSDRAEPPAAAAKPDDRAAQREGPPDADAAEEYARERPSMARPRVGRWWLAIALAVIAVVAGLAVIIFDGSSQPSGELHSDSEENVSPDGLEVSDLLATADHDPPQVGDEIRVEFSLKNVGPNPIRFAETFIGARNPRGENVDFAQENQGEVLDPEAAMEIDGARVLDAPGTWEVWPCYSLPRGGCPDEWESFQVAVGE
jgi:hypothetical protein